MSWVHFLQFNSKTFKTFKKFKFKTLFEKLYRKSIKVVCTNRGGEIVSHDLINFVKDKACIDN